MFGGNMPSLADIAAVTNKDDGNNNGFGNGNGAWWILVIILVLFGAFNGRNGWGNGAENGNNGGATTVVYDTGASMQRGFDNSLVISKLDGLGDGVCSLGYDQLAQMNALGQNVTQTGFNIIQAINQDTVAGMQNANAIERQLDGCCCENRAAIAQVRYDMATNACAVNNNVHQTGDAIIQSQNQGFQMLNNTINDRFTRLEMAQKDAQIAELQMQLNRCDRDSALQGMSSYIISSLNPTARPAYIVQNPNCCGPVPVQVVANGQCNNPCTNMM